MKFNFKSWWPWVLTAILAVIAAPILSVEYGNVLDGFVDWQDEMRVEINTHGWAAIGGLTATYFAYRGITWFMKKNEAATAAKSVETYARRRVMAILALVLIIMSGSWLLAWAGNYRDEMHDIASTIGNFFSDGTSEVKNWGSDFWQNYSDEILTGIVLLAASLLVGMLLQRFDKKKSAKWVLCIGLALAMVMPVVIAWFGNDISDAWNNGYGYVTDNTMNFVIGAVLFSTVFFLKRYRNRKAIVISFVTASGYVYITTQFGNDILDAWNDYTSLFAWGGIIIAALIAGALVNRRGSRELATAAALAIIVAGVFGSLAVAVGDSDKANTGTVAVESNAPVKPAPSATRSVETSVTTAPAPVESTVAPTEPNDNVSTSPAKPEKNTEVICDEELSTQMQGMKDQIYYMWMLITALVGGSTIWILLRRRSSRLWRR